MSARTKGLVALLGLFIAAFVIGCSGEEKPAEITGDVKTAPSSGGGSKAKPPTPSLD